MKSANVYADPRRAESYARLEFPGTYYLAYRDLPKILAQFARGTRALDFGCGTGRSTRFLRELGFDVVGIDISAEMIQMARQLDPHGKYIVVEDGELNENIGDEFDVVLAVFTFDNIPGAAHRVKLLSALGERLKSTGLMLLVDSTPELYLNEWASFSTAKACPSNLTARSGDVVYTVMLDVEDRRPVEDTLWLDDDYRAAFAAAQLELVDTQRPLARTDEPYIWVNETRIAPWVIYVLQPIIRDASGI
jgi:SAM-dependent methyltransferase